LSTLIAVSYKKQTRNPKTQTVRKLLEQEGSKITLFCVPSHVGIPGNEDTDNAVKKSLDKNIQETKNLLAGSSKLDDTTT
jgi:phosphoribosylformylglycinamidine (FGAM) synthase PurS component